MSAKQFIHNKSQMQNHQTEALQLLWPLINRKFYFEIKKSFNKIVAEKCCLTFSNNFISCQNWFLYICLMTSWQHFDNFLNCFLWKKIVQVLTSFIFRSELSYWQKYFFEISSNRMRSNKLMDCQILSYNVNFIR